VYLSFLSPSFTFSFPPFLSYFVSFHSFPIFTLIVWLLYLLHLLSYPFPVDLCCSLLLVACCTLWSYVLLQPALGALAATHIFRNLSCHHQGIEMSCGFIVLFYSVLYYNDVKTFSFCDNSMWKENKCYNRNIDFILY
jgi:hypothetical protein